MKRTPLSIGSIIQAKGGSSYTYIIDRVIGDGASSIVYEAHYIDNAYGRHDVRLKECYPYASDIQRSGTELIWSDTTVATADKVAFTTAYHKLLDFQNTIKLRNSTEHIFDLCEANGTLYYVMDVNEGQTFEQDDSKSLSDILKTALALARVVEKYHNNGYLHLDIKPSNFLVIPETRELVILFDVDSATAIEDIKSDKVKCVSYSKGWAAPEQMQGKIDKLCPATDIYSIGAILFQKVMGRSVENEDIGIFADWDFEGEIFEKVNPKIRRLLRNIFRKTLSANIKKRYQSVDALISALEASVECVRDGAPYLISDRPNPNRNFLGREKELVDIATAFKNGKKTVFLHGFGGIGKSELAKKYAELHEKEYDAILFLSYEDSLEDLLDDIQIQNCDAESKNDNIKILKKIFTDQRILLIVDNFDVEIDSDDYLDAFLCLKVDKIFTTRTDFTDIADDKTQQISIENLKSKELVSLFEKESTLSFTNEDRAMIEEILKLFNYYTLIVPILAKQLASSGWSLEILRDKAKQGLRAFEDTEKVAVAKDGRIYRKTGLDMMRATFRMVGLTDIQRRVLTNLYFLRFVKINKEGYRKYLWKENEERTKHIDAINELANRKWIDIKKPEDYLNIGMSTSYDLDISIHPIITEMIEIELKPDITKNEALIQYISYFMPWRELNDELFDGVYGFWDELEKDTITQQIEWFLAFVNILDFNNYNNFCYALNSLYKIINGNIFIVELIPRWQRDKLIKKLSIPTIPDDLHVRFMLYNILQVFWFSDLPWYKYDDYGDDFLNESQENARKYFWLSYEALQSIDAHNKEHFVWKLCKPVIQSYNNSSAIPDDIYNILKTLENACVNVYEDIYHWDYKYDPSDGVMKPFKEIVPIPISDWKGITSEEVAAFSGEKSNTEKLQDYFVDAYFSNQDIISFNQELMAESKLTNDEKHSVYYSILDRIFAKVRLSFGASENFDEMIINLDIEKTTKLLDLQEEFFYDVESFEDEFEAAETNNLCDAYRALIFALSGDMEKHDEYAEILIQEFQKSFSKKSQRMHWSHFTNFEDLRFLTLNIGHIVTLCEMLKSVSKSGLALSYVIRCTDYIHDWVKTLPNYSELMMYSWYKVICEYADDASNDVSDISQSMKYYSIYSEYEKKLNEMTGKNFEIKYD